jgi:hypothetical protein
VNQLSGLLDKGQDYEVRYEAEKAGRSASAMKNPVKKVGNSRKRVEKRIAAEGRLARVCGMAVGGHQILRRTLGRLSEKDVRLS